MNQDTLQKLVEKLSLEKFNRRFSHTASFNRRLRTTGGRYHLKSHDLDFNPEVLKVHGQDIFEGIILHELCHYHLHLEKKGYRHKDKAFKELLREVGGLRYTPPLQHQVEKPQWQYRCTGCLLTIQRQRRFNVNKFLCAKCRSRFKLIEQE